MADDMIANPIHFWSKVRHAGPDECWEWSGYSRRRTAGALSYGGYRREDGKTVRAHRFAYEAAIGPIPAGAFVCHSCDNPRCCNPKHLWLGDAAANNRDRHAKGRTVLPPVGCDKQHAIGVEHGLAKLTDELARAIFLDRRSSRVVGRAFGVDNKTVLSIKKRRTWAHATEGLQCQT